MYNNVNHGNVTAWSVIANSLPTTSNIILIRPFLDKVKRITNITNAIIRAARIQPAMFPYEELTSCPEPVTLTVLSSVRWHLYTTPLFLHPCRPKQPLSMKPLPSRCHLRSTHFFVIFGFVIHQSGHRSLRTRSYSLTSLYVTSFRVDPDSQVVCTRSMKSISSTLRLLVLFFIQQQAVKLLCALFQFVRLSRFQTYFITITNPTYNFILINHFCLS